MFTELLLSAVDTKNKAMSNQTGQVGLVTYTYRAGWAVTPSWARRNRPGATASWRNQLRQTSQGSHPKEERNTWWMEARRASAEALSCRGPAELGLGPAP